MRENEIEQIRRIYTDMPQETFAQIERDELTEIGQRVYDEELQRRKSPEFASSETAWLKKREAEERLLSQWSDTPRPTGVTVIFLLLTIGALLSVLLSLAVLAEDNDVETYQVVVLVISAIIQAAVGISLFRGSNLARYLFLILVPVLLFTRFAVGLSGNPVFGALGYLIMSAYLFSRRPREYFSYNYWLKKRNNANQ